MNRHGWLLRRNGLRRVFGPVTGCDLACDIDHTPDDQGNTDAT